MTGEMPTNSPERRETLDDNARKFVVENMPPQVLHGAKKIFTLVTDWLETNKDDETKLAHKTHLSGEVEALLITKVTNDDGSRTSEKKVLTTKTEESEEQEESEGQYEELLPSSIERVAKLRYEFAYTQDGHTFDMKYDEFEDSTLRVLEVDAATEEERASFDPTKFPAQLIEVTENLDYYGYRIAKVL